MTQSQPRPSFDSPPRRPPRLFPGARIGVCAPASPIRREYLERGETALRALGFDIVRSRHIFAKGRYTAGSIEERLADLRQLLEADEVNAVFCARGGYGVSALLPLLAPQLIRAADKIVLGSSDITSLLMHVLDGANCVTFHGPMASADIARGEADLGSLFKLLTLPEAFGPLPSTGLRALHGGSADGILTGGCLSLVVSLLGTPFEPVTDNRLLFLEDTGAKPYQIDRMLTQLSQAGKLTRVRGIVFGEMLGCVQHPDQGYELDDVLRDLTAQFDVPVLSGLRSGHTSGDALTLPFGVEARLVTTPPSLEILSPAVR